MFEFRSFAQFMIAQQQRTAAPGHEHEGQNVRGEMSPGTEGAGITVKDAPDSVITVASDIEADDKPDAPGLASAIVAPVICFDLIGSATRWIVPSGAGTEDFRATWKTEPPLLLPQIL